MHIHILGICGTFMGGLALLARELGHQVSSSDENVYPPMSTQLEEQGIVLMEGYDPAHLDPAPDLVIVGNAMSRGNPAVEYVLEKGIDYTSGPQWLGQAVLKDRWVLAISGTHGKTTTTAMLSWILEDAGMNPGFLVGGIPANFGISARLGSDPFFVIEADEYDTAFFDKRSKFVHYHPRTLVINNLEFDHADIFENLQAIQKQFHHVIRIVPGSGQVIYPGSSEAIRDVLEMGVWSETCCFALQNEHLAAADWITEMHDQSGSNFSLHPARGASVDVQWSLIGEHNVMNATAALLAARHAGIDIQQAANSLQSFESVKRRLENLGTVNGVTVYDDFAHHPTAIELTLKGLRARVGDNEKILAVIEPRSNTMRMGIHKQALLDCTAMADEVFWYQPAGLDWSLDEIVNQSPEGKLFDDIEALVEAVVSCETSPMHVLVMSNGGFAGIHQKLLSRLESDE